MLKIKLYSRARFNIVSVRFVSKENESGKWEPDPTVKPLKNSNVYAQKRGTGGRSSFNGMVATVFGASGFLGRYVCNKLGKIGTQLIIPYACTHYDVRRLKLVGDLGQVFFMPYQLNKPETIKTCIRYSNVVINLVGRDWETKNFKFHDVHVKGACNIADAVKDAGIETFVHVSALNVSEDPEPYMLPEGSEFLASKWEGETAVKSIFPDVIVFRPSDIYGSGDRFLCYFSNNWRHQFEYLPLYKKGECTEKQPVFASDVAAGIVAACKNKKFRGQIIQAVGPSRYLLSELVDWFHRIRRKDFHAGYKRYDIKYDPLFKLRITLLPKLVMNWPLGHLHWEKVEREAHNDIIDKNLPTLESLGITLTHMEDQVPWLLNPLKAIAYYSEELGEFKEPKPPKKIDPRSEKKDGGGETSSESDSDEEEEGCKEDKSEEEKGKGRDECKEGGDKPKN